ncbi:MAG: 7-cyano-7-deazaguanine synthase [Clostridia bacterium]|nr:7-cyano-7-deazaguanine synthase [Clostridia bacterium]MBQ6467378.1 7-cyano-7-deazaguanine synthase [Clostridia bacterium]
MMLLMSELLNDFVSVEKNQLLQTKYKKKVLSNHMLLFFNKDTKIIENSKWLIIVESTYLSKKEILELFDKVSKRECIDESYLKVLFKKFAKFFCAIIINYETNDTFLIRDKIGYYSLYYYKHKRGLVICDDLSFFNYFPFTNSINEEYIYHSLTLFLSHPTTTLYKSVYEVQPRNILHISGGKEKLISYASFNEIIGPNNETNEELIINRMHNLIRNGCKKYNQQVFTLLSGGIDSGIIAASLVENNNDVLAITIDYEHNSKEIDIKNAKAMAKKLNLQNHQIINVTNNDILNTFYSMVNDNYPPIFTIDMIMIEIASKKIKEIMPNNPVCFAGDGADELGGYPSYIDIQNEWGNLLYFYSLPIEAKKILVQQTDCKAYEIAMNNHPIPRKFIQAFYESEKKMIWLNEFPTVSSYDIIANQFYDADLNFFQKIQNVEFSLRLPSFYFRRQWRQYNEKNIKVIYPFLDEKLLKYCLSLPRELHMKNNIPKYLFKKIYKRYYPDISIDNKNGFGSVLYNFYLDVLPGLIQTELANIKRYSSCLFNEDYIYYLLEHISEKNNGFKLWTIYAINQWISQQKRKTM